ncbi:MAG: tetratricopeptide repeat protein [Candidatus Daviesbacteria bacterium]
MIINLEKLFEEAQGKRNNNQIPEAIEDYQKVRDEAQNLGNRELSAESLHMIGVAYYQDKKYPQAEEMLDKAQKEFEEMGNNLLVGAIQRDRGLIAFEEKSLEKAQDFLRESIQTLEKIGNLGHLGVSQVKLGVVEAARGDTLEGETTIMRGIDNISQSPDKFFLATGYFDLAKVQKQTGKIDEARKSWEKSLEILNQISGQNEFKSRREEITKFIKNLESNP